LKTCPKNIGECLSSNFKVAPRHSGATQLAVAKGDKEKVMDIVATVYSKPNCVQCTATYRELDKKGHQL